QAGTVTLAADHDDLPVVVRRLRDAVGGGRVEAPLQHGPVDDDRSGEVALLRALDVGARVDEQGAGLDRLPRLPRAEAPHAGPRPSQKIVYSGHSRRLRVFDRAAGGARREDPPASEAGWGTSDISGRVGHVPEQCDETMENWVFSE